MSGPLPTPDSHALGRKAREVFIAHAEGVMAPLADALRAKLIELVDQSASTKEMQDRRDAMLEFERLHKAWVEGVPKAWRRALIPPTATARVRRLAGSAGDAALLQAEVEALGPDHALQPGHQPCHGRRDPHAEGGRAGPQVQAALQIPLDLEAADRNLRTIHD